MKEGYYFMENNYILYAGMDFSKGKADAAILKVSDRRSVKPKIKRKKLSFKFVKSEVTFFRNCKKLFR